MTKAEKIKRKGYELGFSRVGITTADDFDDFLEEILSREDYEIWTSDDRVKYVGRCYLSEAARPRSYYPQGQSIICATLGYSQYVYPEKMSAHVARAYLARGYTPQKEDIAGIREEEFKRFIRSLGIGLYEGISEVPQRAACARAGIITYGKNNFAYTKEDGSFNILYTFLVDTVLDYDTPTERCECPENCFLCSEACPADAILAPGRLYPRNCAVNNHQLPMEDFPEDLWGAYGVRIHGCDECQLVCPRNAAVLRKASRRDPLVEEISASFDLEKILHLDESYYEENVRPIMYNYIRDMDLFKRNAAIALGNAGDASALPALEKALEVNQEKPALLRPIRWAIEQLKKEQD